MGLLVVILFYAGFIALALGPVLGFAWYRRARGRHKNDELASGGPFKMLSDDCVLFEHNDVSIRVWPHFRGTSTWNAQSVGVEFAARFVFGHNLVPPRDMLTLDGYSFDAFANTRDLELPAAAHLAIDTLAGCGRMTLKLDDAGLLSLSINPTGDDAGLTALKSFWALTAVLGGDADPLVPGRDAFAAAVGGASGAPIPVRL